jgi:phospholipid transport system transporter-binding protein
VTKFVEKITLDITENNTVLAGELTRQTVMQISKKSIKQLVVQQSLILDLRQVTRIDTAGLAWLFYLLEQASIANCQLSFSNVPAKLNKLISLSGVEGFLPVYTPKL